jgi:hypothetical protein
VSAATAGTDEASLGATLHNNAWIFSRNVDLATFTGTAVVALVLVWLAPYIGVVAPTESPTWTWISAVLLVDVAHVWSTIFVTYWDPFERRRRSWLYSVTPLVAYLAACALYQLGDAVFWRTIAYLAAFHFVRQQFGWMMMYRGRAGQRDRLGRWLDGGLIYATMLYPLIVWHTTLPRNFWWMRERDFAAGLPAMLADVALVLYVALAIAYVGRAVRDIVTGTAITWGKHLLVITTAACWYLGIIGSNSDYAFTVTNIFIHGIPYMVLVFIYARRVTVPALDRGVTARMLAKPKYALLLFVTTLWAIAYAEELLWDHAAWHEHAALFGGSTEQGLLAQMAPWLVPLLVTPQLVHYILDGFLWRRSNPRLGSALRPTTTSPPS